MRESVNTTQNNYYLCKGINGYIHTLTAPALGPLTSRNNSPGI